jgi:hypothetical protein
MKRYIKLLLPAAAAATVLTACATGRKSEAAARGIPIGNTETNDKGEIYHRGVLIVYFDARTGSGQLLKAARKYGSEIIYKYNIINAVALKVPQNKTDEEAIAYFSKVKGVVSVERDRIYHLDGEPQTKKD